jgi:hypothetical protein
MVDFVDEVGDALKRDEQMQAAKKLWPAALGLVVAVIVGVGGYQGFKAWNQRALAQASVQYEGALKSLDGGDVAAAKKQLDAMSQKGPKVYRAMALMQLGAAAVTENRLKDALSAYDRASGLFSDPLMANAARLKAAYIFADIGAYKELQARLKPLTADDAPFRYLARELLATAAMTHGDVEQARDLYQALTLALDAPKAVQQRASASLALLPKKAANKAPAKDSAQ